MEESRIVIHADPDLADDIPWYMGQVKDYTKAIEKAVSENDFETIEDAGHRMKGSGQAFGFDGVSEMGKSLEVAAKEKNFDEIGKELKELVRYMERVEVVYEES